MREGERDLEGAIGLAKGSARHVDVFVTRSLGFICLIVATLSSNDLGWTPLFVLAPLILQGSQSTGGA